QQFLVFFLLMPAYIPLSIATFSIIGEKQARTLEPVLATPIRTAELLAGKAIAALVPGVVAGWVTYIAFVVLASVVYGPNLFGVVTDGSWLAGVFALGPAVGLSSVVAGVIVSSRVNDPRVAQQIGGIVVVPIIGMTLLQATGTVLVGVSGFLLLAAIVLAISVVGLRIGVALFDREAILTRWR
nr:ABC transporter permease [Chloroflexota bacterium]